LSEDPIGFYGGDVNLYAYVGNNPVRWIDPDGLLGTDRFWIPAGEGYGRDALDYYADVLNDPCSSGFARAGAYAGGFFSALWTRETSNATFVTLAGGYATRVLGPFSPRGLPRPIARVRRYVRLDPPHHGKGWELDGTVPKWIRSFF
jgi:uncharacterized protein RhaS with RHS repeats